MTDIELLQHSPAMESPHREHVDMYAYFLYEFIIHIEESLPSFPVPIGRCPSCFQRHRQGPVLAGRGRLHRDRRCQMDRLVRRRRHHLSLRCLVLLHPRDVLDSSSRNRTANIFRINFWTVIQPAVQTSSTACTMILVVVVAGPTCTLKRTPSCIIIQHRQG